MTQNRKRNKKLAFIIRMKELSIRFISIPTLNRLFPHQSLDGLSFLAI
jgi:hypothetical protein